jgi:acetyl-CoA acetyltransferase
VDNRPTLGWRGLGSRASCDLIVDPLRLYDCCMESDGAVALVLVSDRRARSLDVAPVVVKAAAQSLPSQHVTMTSYNDERMASLPAAVNQVSGAQYAVATSGPGIPTSGVVLGL